MESFHSQELGQEGRSSLIDVSDPAKKAYLLKTHKMSSDEFATLTEILGRLPTFAELGVFSAMWSEHCSYKSSRVHLKRFPTSGKHVVVGPGENAGVVRLFDRLCVAFKMESHNHPSYIEPYQGAATGVGGILRDVFCMGARPIANLNCLRFGDKTHPKTPWLLSHVVKGIGDYGNCVGVPTVGGNLSFDACYDGNCLVNAMTVGLIEEDKIFKGFASGLGNLVVYVGSATGRDGIHGATMASDSFDSEQASSRGAVQVGDPFTEKLLLEATLEVLQQGLVIGIQDMGAAGLTSSSFEMADRAGTGLLLDLNRVPVRAEGMTAYELLLSESQERMLMVIKPECWQDLAKVLEKWQLAYNVIGEVTNSGRVQAYYKNKLEVDVPVAQLATKAPCYERPLKSRELSSNNDELSKDCTAFIRANGFEKALQICLQDNGSHEFIFRQYDQHIGGKSALGSENGGGALLWIQHTVSEAKMPYLGLGATTACNEAYCRNNPRLGSSYAVLKAARSLAAMGVEPLAITDCLNFGNPEDPLVMWEFSESVDGISEACRQLEIAVVSGNVSLYNETDGKSIYPTPMIGMVGRCDDVRLAAPGSCQRPSQLFLLSSKMYRPGFAASSAAKGAGYPVESGQLGSIDWALERQSMAFIAEILKTKNIHAIRDIGRGGLATTVAKMTLANGLGFALFNDSQIDGETFYFGETAMGYVIACCDGIEGMAALIPPDSRLAITPIGSCHLDPTISMDGNSVNFSLLWDTYQSALDI